MEDNACDQCKWMNQGKISRQCFNPTQSEKRYMDYTHPSFSCAHFEAGARVSDDEMKEMGYVKHPAITVRHWEYWTKRNV